MARTSRGGGARRARASSPAAKVQRQAIPSSEELINLIGTRPVAAEVAEFGGLRNFADEFYRPKKYRNLAGEAIGILGGADTGELDITGPYDPSESYEYIDGRGNRIDTSIFRQSFDLDDETGELLVPGFKGPQEGESNLPAPISVVPTSTSNLNRPRTVSEWNAFKATVSKGKYIYKVLDYKPRGDASMKGLAPGVRKNLYSISRAAQRGFGGKQKGIK